MCPKYGAVSSRKSTEKQFERTRRRYAVEGQDAEELQLAKALV